MGVTICFSFGGGDDHPLSDRAYWDEHMRDSMHMPNGAAAVLVNILCLSGGRLAETESQKRMMVYLAEQNQTALGLGNVDLDIDCLPWDRAHFAEDKAFMLRVIEGARQKLGWETLCDRYEPNAERVKYYLDGYQVLMERMTEADIKDEVLTEWLDWHDPDEPPKCGFPKCSKHDAYIALYGCQVCMD